MRRRVLLGAAAGLAAAPAAAQGAARERLRRRLADLRLGANLERWYPIARDNQPRRLGREWWRGFRAAGFDHARLFIPDVSQTGDSQEVLRLFQQAVEDAVAMGVPVLLGLADFFYHSHPWPERYWQALRSRAAFFGPRLDPEHVVLAPINEPAFPDTATWLPVRDRLLGEVRRAAPAHLLMWGGREWCSARSLLEATPPADPGTIAEAHDYQAGSPEAVRARFAPVAAWRERHGLPVLVSELGGAEANKQNPAALAEDLRQVLPVLRELRLPAALWAYTHGGWWRLQRGDDSAPRPEIRAALG
ncbi:cellulase family glycosylhydrolase [Crenalkalicoccus roseus]|uniref:cellulase family glycosylhydrolase n=1 Tax=Crenalkalicoccus roseus TaxID=1485588 RepID=UPI001081BC4A|nr:cellulase family glycosylhydrolase [Crenalkalicoccus roseus]